MPFTLQDLYNEFQKRSAWLDEDKKWVEASRTVTYITTLAVKIKNRGVQLVWMLVSMEFVKTAHALDRNLRQVPLMNNPNTIQSFPGEAG